jgi:hypothetical protein
MTEYDAIFSSAQATGVFYLISSIGLSALILVAFTAWVRREWALLQAERPAPRRAPRRAARQRTVTVISGFR